MPNYNSNLKSWGASGAEYPDGYAHAEGDRPVDDWENFLKNNLIEDTSHLINVTNQPVTINAGTQLTGGGAVELGETITINLDDGSGSGLDADLLDGEHASAFADSGHTHDSRYLLESGDTMGGELTLSGGAKIGPNSGDRSEADFEYLGLSNHSDNQAYIRFSEGSDFGGTFGYDGSGSGDGNKFVFKDSGRNVIGEIDFGGNFNATSTISESGNRVATRVWATGSNILHSELSDAPSSAHHTRYSDGEARGAIEAGNVNHIDMPNNLRLNEDGSGHLDIRDRSGGRAAIEASRIYLSNNIGWFDGNHDDLSGVSSSDHHSRYSDEEAQDAVGLNVGNALSYDDSNAKIYVSEGSISHDNIGGVSASDHHSRYSDSEARSALEDGNVTHVQFNNTETVGDGQIGRDNSMGFIGQWASQGMAVLWDSYNVSAGNQINISGGKGDESTPTIAVNDGGGSGLNADLLDGNHASDLGSDVSDNGTTIVSNATDINFGSNIDVTDDTDGTVTVDGTPGYTDENAQDAVGGILDSDLTYDDANNVIGLAATLGVDITGDADTLDGNHAGAFANSGHTHDGRYINDGDAIPHPVYSSKSNIPNLSEGESAYVSGDGLYIEDGT